LKTKKSEAKAPQSEARRQLAGMIVERATLTAKVEVLHAAAMKLDGAMTAAGPLEAKLAALDASESAAMSAWAKAGADGPAPKVDAKAREALNKSIATARAGAVAATAAYSSITGEHADTSRAIATLAIPMEIEIAAIISEECQPLIAEYDLESRQLAAKRVRLTQAYERILATLDKVRGTAPGQPVSFSFETMHARLKLLFTAPPQDDDAASQSRQAWRALEDGLWTDANAKLSRAAGEKVAGISAPAPEVDIAVIAKKRLSALDRLASIARMGI
jgi:hypothetical protein